MDAVLTRKSFLVTVGVLSLGSFFRLLFAAGGPIIGYRTGRTFRRPPATSPNSIIDNDGFVIMDSDNEEIEDYA